MVLSNMGDHSGEGLSMKFKERSEDTVYFDASAQDKTALLAFIEASIDDFDTYTVDISNFGTSMENLQAMHSVISEQSGNDEPVEMSTYLFGQMGTVANAWKTNGFEHAFPEDHDKLDADKDTVYAVHDMFYDCFNIDA